MQCILLLLFLLHPIIYCKSCYTVALNGLVNNKPSSSRCKDVLPILFFSVVAAWIEIWREIFIFCHLSGSLRSLALLACINIPQDTNCIKCWWKSFIQCISNIIFPREKGCVDFKSHDGIKELPVVITQYNCCKESMTMPWRKPQLWYRPPKSLWETFSDGIDRHIRLSRNDKHRDRCNTERHALAVWKHRRGCVTSGVTVR